MRTLAVLALLIAGTVAAAPGTSAIRIASNVFLDPTSGVYVISSNELIGVSATGKDLWAVPNVGYRISPVSGLLAVTSQRRALEWVAQVIQPSDGKTAATCVITIPPQPDASTSTAVVFEHDGRSFSAWQRSRWPATQGGSPKPDAYFTQESAASRRAFACGVFELSIKSGACTVTAARLEAAGLTACVEGRAWLPPASEPSIDPAKQHVGIEMRAEIVTPKDWPCCITKPAHGRVQYLVVRDDDGKELWRRKIGFEAPSEAVPVTPRASAPR